MGFTFGTNSQVGWGQAEESRNDLCYYQWNRWAGAAQLAMDPSHGAWRLLSQCLNFGESPSLEVFILAKRDFPVTSAVRWLEARGISFIPRLYGWEEHGGTHAASEKLREDEHCVIKTLVMEDEKSNKFLVLMHGDWEVSTKNLARLLDVKKIEPCSHQTAEKVTGYQVGGISPFGTRQSLPVYIQETVLAMPRILINGGKRGFLLEISPEVLEEKLGAIPVEVRLE